MNGDEPAKVADRIIAELRSRERDGLIVLPPPARPSPRFQPGDRVRITDGPLMGFSGLVDGMRSHERVAVLLKLLGRVELPAVDVKRIA